MTDTTAALARRAFALFALFICSFAGAAERPNLVLFIADDLSWHDVGTYGNRDVRTPNLDQLAREGMTFQRAFAASPTCAPSRSALFTGTYPMRNGAHANHSVVSSSLRTWPEYLNSLGYRTVIAGKTHFGPRERFPFEYLANSNVNAPGKPEVLNTDLGTAAIEALLKSHDRKQPLALVVAAHSPHVYWPEINGYTPANLTLKPYMVDTPETRAALARYYTDVTQMDREVGIVRAALDRFGYAKNTLFMFTSDQGAQFPAAKWSLYDAGIRVPLIAAWPGHTPRSASNDAIVSLVDVLPTMVEAGGGEAPKDIDGRSFTAVLEGKSTQHLDAAFAAHTGDGEMNRAPSRAIRTARFKYIANLRPDITYGTHISEGNGKDGRDYWDTWVKLAETDPAAARLVRRYRDKPADELYDLANDPFELVNLAGDPAYARTLVDLRGRLDAWRVQQGERLDFVPMPEDAQRGKLLYRE
ncbi:sulfatase [Steroidobacter sp.]|uniref:sulfatase family protein n=1 Tax=Steroidobacter sp. TaxID=1978227 RepID=UPI001A5C4A38|nr:sulfatase [Steroidobacter sp.]MBL8267353.1 sulfatase [Steroidobacter sp.]